MTEMIEVEDGFTEGLARRGSIFCLLFGVGGVISSICYLLLDKSSRYLLLPENFYSIESINAYLSHPIIFTTFWCVNAINALLIIGIVVAYYSLVRHRNRVLVGWLSVMAIIGLAFLALSNIHAMMYFPQFVDVYQNGNEITKEGLLLFRQGFHFDYGIFSYGLPSFWFMVASIMALDNRLIPKGLVMVGVLIGASLLGVSFGAIFDLPLVLKVSKVLVMISFPIWGLWEFIYLKEISKR